jgi:hypothetical protein
VIEEAVKRAIAELLSAPERLIAELTRLKQGNEPDRELREINDALSEVEGRQRRLVRLFTEGGLPAELLEEQRRELSLRRTVLEEERQRLESQSGSGVDEQELRANLPDYCHLVDQWVTNAEGDSLDLLLRAVDAQIIASSEEARIRGSVPVLTASQIRDLVTIEQTSA